MDKAGVFHKVTRIDDSRLAELFAHEVLGYLVHKELVSCRPAQLKNQINS